MVQSVFVPTKNNMVRDNQNKNNNNTILEGESASCTSGDPDKKNTDQSDHIWKNVLATTNSTRGAALQDDSQKDTWRPPKDQDGSGYTKLNQKFAGRY